MQCTHQHTFENNATTRHQISSSNIKLLMMKLNAMNYSIFLFGISIKNVNVCAQYGPNIMCKYQDIIILSSDIIFDLMPFYDFKLICLVCILDIRRTYADHIYQKSVETISFTSFNQLIFKSLQMISLSNL